MKTIIIAIALLAFGCGGYEDQANGGTDQYVDDGSIGTAELPLSVNSSKYGVSTASSRITCRSDGPSGQSCLVPTSKTIQYCYSNAGGTWSAAEITQAQNFGAGNLQSLNSFTFSRQFAGQQSEQNNCANAGLMTKLIKGTCSGGSTSANIEAFVCWTPANTASLTESLPGSWSKQQGGTIVVDLADINAHADSACVEGHGIKHMLAAVAGIGNDTTVPDAFGTLITTRAVSPTTFSGTCVHSQFTSQEQCFAASVNTGGGGGGGFMAFNGTTCP
jgi:hypothetical protein